MQSKPLEGAPIELSYHDRARIADYQKELILQEKELNRLRQLLAGPPTPRIDVRRRLEINFRRHAASVNSIYAAIGKIVVGSNKKHSSNQETARISPVVDLPTDQGHSSQKQLPLAPALMNTDVRMVSMPLDMDEVKRLAQEKLAKQYKYFPKPRNQYEEDNFKAENLDEYDPNEPPYVTKT